MKKKAELEVEKLILEQIKLRQELIGINEPDPQLLQPESMPGAEEQEAPNDELQMINCSNSIDETLKKETVWSCMYKI